MNNKHSKTLKAIFSKPVSSNIKWKDIEKMFIHLGAKITQGNGSRVRIILNNVAATFHRPHPKPETDRGVIVSLQEYLKEAGVSYDNEI